MSWNYVLSRSKGPDGEMEFGVRELYFADGKYGWTAEVIAPSGETPKELRKDLKRMLKDIQNGNLLDLTVDPPRLVLRLRTEGDKK